MNLDRRLTAIRTGLEQLRTCGKSLDVFGAENHGFVLNRPLGEPVVKRFETKHGIKLPADYRRFIIELGNGGAGPYYGIFKLGEMDNCFDQTKWRERDGFVGVLSRPFPHTTKWNNLTKQPKASDDEDGYEKAMDEFDRRYWDSKNINGAIPLCHEGCALRDWLVITGREAGHMWHDARADYSGLWPIGRKNRYTFLDWYLKWLGRSLAIMRKSLAK